MATFDKRLIENYGLKVITFSLLILGTLFFSIFINCWDWFNYKL